MMSLRTTLVLLAIAHCEGFLSSPQNSHRVSQLNDAVGGWGIGAPRDITPEEMGRGDRRAFEGYRMTDRGDFMRKVRADRENFAKDEFAELLGVAKSAGINVKDPKERLNKFEAEDLFLDEDDDLDLTVPDEPAGKIKYDESITRTDEDTGAMGEW